MGLPPPWYLRPPQLNKGSWIKGWLYAYICVDNEPASLSCIAMNKTGLVTHRLDPWLDPEWSRTTRTAQLVGICSCSRESRSDGGPDFSSRGVFPIPSWHSWQADIMVNVLAVKIASNHNFSWVWRIVQSREVTKDHQSRSATQKYVWVIVLDTYWYSFPKESFPPVLFSNSSQKGIGVESIIIQLLSNC